MARWREAMAGRGEGVGVLVRRSPVPRVILDIYPTPISVGRYRFVSAVRFPPPSFLESTPTLCCQKKKSPTPTPVCPLSVPCPALSQSATGGYGEIVTVCLTVSKRERK